MSEFFDKKQEVLDVKLTRYGRELFSTGKLEPKYYAFFDDDVLYDVRYVSGSSNELYGEFKNRIDNDTPNLKIIPNFISVDDKSRDKIENQNLVSQLGSSKFGEQKYPAFRVSFLQGEITGSTGIITGPSISERIPTMNVDIQLDYTPNFSLIEQKSLLLKIEELNGIYEKENFDLEVSEIIYHTPLHKSPVTSSNKLTFINPALMDNSEISFFDENPLESDSFTEGLPNINPSNVEYYLTILTDYELSKIMSLEKAENNIYDIINVDEIKKDC